MYRKISRKLTFAAISLTLFMLTGILTTSANDTTPNVVVDYGVAIEQTTTPPYFVKPGERLTYTLSVENTHWQELHLTITDTLPLHVTTDEHLAGTAILPGGKLVWTPVLTPSETWVQQVAVTVELGYTGPLTNIVAITSREGPYGTSIHRNMAALEISRAYFPLIVRNYPKTGMLLTNPGFEGIGVPVDNAAPNYGNWTRDTFTGEQYGEIYTPEGWVTWWEKGEYGRPECHIIANEPPFLNPSRIYQGYYAGKCSTYMRKQHAGYYQVVDGLKPGAMVEGWYYAHAWACDENNTSALSCGDPEAFSFRVGIDPDGGVDPFADTILWSDEQFIYDIFERVGPVQVTVGENGAVTFFLRSHGKWAYQHNDAYWDNPSLYYVEP